MICTFFLFLCLALLLPSWFGPPLPWAMECIFPWCPVRGPLEWTRRVFRRVRLLFGACSLKIRPDQKITYGSTKSDCQMTATQTKSQHARPSHTQHLFQATRDAEKVTAKKHDPETITCSLTTCLGPIAQTTGSSVTLATWERSRPPRIRRKTILEFRLKNTMCASRPGVALAESERERERACFSDTEVHPWNRSRSSKPPWTNLPVLLGERSEPQSRTLLFGFLLQRTSARRKLLT